MFSLHGIRTMKMDMEMEKGRQIKMFVFIMPFETSNVKTLYDEIDSVKIDATWDGHRFMAYGHLPM